VDQSLESNVPHAAGSPTLEHYLDGAVRLRQAATWNTFDSNLAAIFHGASFQSSTPT
jgi:hypothetical protein